MHVWIVLFGLLFPNPQGVVVDGVSTPGGDEPLRYRGIEALLAKFDAESESADQNR
jgi:hypothetical protein